MGTFNKIRIPLICENGSEKQQMGMWHNDCTLLFDIRWSKQYSRTWILMQIQLSLYIYIERSNRKKGGVNLQYPKQRRFRFRKRTLIKESLWKSEIVGTKQMKLLWKMENIWRKRQNKKKNWLEDKNKKKKKEGLGCLIIS